MPSEQLENIITMLRAQAAGRGEVEMSLQQWRDAYDGLGAMLPAADGVPAEAVDAGGVPGEWIGRGDGPVVLYLHGGGYCIGSLDSHRSMLTHLAAAVGGQVLAVDYRLAPEHPFPAALDDACTAYRWVLTSGIAPGRLVVGGDSAGGGLALATLVALRDAGDPLPAAGVFLSPWADLTQTGATISEKAEIDPMVRVEDLDRWAAAYAGVGGDPGDRRLNPLFADLSGLPPPAGRGGHRRRCPRVSAPVKRSTRGVCRQSASGVSGNARCSTAELGRACLWLVPVPWAGRALARR
jgi:acetyl esterase/lipase